MTLKSTIAGIAAISVCFATTTAAANDTMDVLVTGKQLQVTTAAGASFTVSFNANGQYTTSTGSSGTWTMNGDVLCTLKTGASAESCGELPSGKKCRR